jgi:hypothetical protein
MNAQDLLNALDERSRGIIAIRELAAAALERAIAEAPHSGAVLALAVIRVKQSAGIRPSAADRAALASALAASPQPSIADEARDSFEV